MCRLYDVCFTAKTLQLSVQHKVIVISQRPCCILVSLGLSLIKLPDVLYSELYSAHVFVIVPLLLTGYLVHAFMCVNTSGDICLLY